MTTAAPKKHLEFYSHIIPSPIGQLTLLVAKSGALAAIRFGAFTEFAPGLKVEPNKYACGPVALQLDEYFSGKRQEFQLELSLEGTPFQSEVWYRLQKIGYGETVSYSELARKVGRRDAVRAVANAVANNPLPLVVPCHRIVPKTGGIGNYALNALPAAEGQRIKAFLLDFEGQEPNR